MIAKRVSARAALGGDPLAHVPAVLETIAGSLRSEFGDVPQVFNFYAGVARGADMDTARRIATSLGQWPANREAAAEARGMLARRCAAEPAAGRAAHAVGH